MVEVLEEIKYNTIRDNGTVYSKGKNYLLLWHEAMQQVQICRIDSEARTTV